MSLLLGLLFGLVQGLRHAFEPDHVVAVSTMLSEHRATRVRMAYAAMWGLGHAAMLVAVGGTLMFLRAKLPTRLDAAFELAVSLMLIVLGLRAIRMAWRARTAALHKHAHRHGSHRQRGFRAVGPLAMGMVHGLAGSGALTALVVARLPSALGSLLFMLVFGAGATLGMASLAGASNVPLSRLVKTRWGMSVLLGATGGISLLLGLLWLKPAVRAFVASE